MPDMTDVSMQRSEPDSNQLTRASDDFSAMQSDLASIEGKYDTQIADERKTAQGYEQQAIVASQQAADESQRAAADQTAADQKITEWLKSTPTRQAAYATTMHAAPIMAVLTALGGRLTRLNGMQMLSATTGIMQGMNTAAEKNYEDSYNAWMSQYQQLKDHQAQLMKAHELMLQSYQGRADAYQKATEAARRMTGDILDEKQHAMSQRVNVFKAQQEAIARLDRVKIAMEQLHQRQLKDLAQVRHWRDMLGRAMSPEKKARMQAEHQQWQNAKAQVDELYKQRGQINSNLNLSEDVKAQMLARVDDHIEALTMAMDQSEARSQALANEADTGTPPPRPQQPRSAPQTLPGTEKPSEGKLKALQQNIGKAVTFGDNSTWIMDQDGSTRRVQ